MCRAGGGRGCGVGAAWPTIFRDRRAVLRADELARLRAVEDDAEATADVFYRFWACKEAYLKLHGTGLTFPSSDFSVALDPAVSRVEWTRLPGDDGVRWHLDAIGTPTPEYRAALCRGEAGPLRGFVLDESP